MYSVLYTHDMEPITILELSNFAYDFLKKHGNVRLAVQLPALTSYLMAMQPPSNLNIKTVTIVSELFYRRGIWHMMLFTIEEENSFLLKSYFLPGQRRSVNDMEDNAFAKGFLFAIQKIGVN